MLANIVPLECEITHANFGGDWKTFVKVMANKLMHPISRTRDWLPPFLILRGLWYKVRYMLFYIYSRFQAAIFDVSLIPTNGSVYISPVVLLDTENIGIAVGILLQACVQVEISYPLPVPCRHP